MPVTTDVAGTLGHSTSLSTLSWVTFGGTPVRLCFACIVVDQGVFKLDYTLVWICSEERMCSALLGIGSGTGASRAMIVGSV